MKCPFCGKDMEIGSVSQNCYYALKWVPAGKSQGILDFIPLVKGIKLTSDLEPVKVFHCSDCRKFVIDEDDLKL